MKQSTTFAQVATNLLNVLQGYTKGIRFVAVLMVLLTMGIGQAWAEGTETFENLTSATDYKSRTWTGVNGQTWSATLARTDQKISGNRGLTFSNASSGKTITMELTDAQKAAGIGTFTFKYKHPYSDSGKTNTFSISVNGSNYSSGTLNYTSSSTATKTITINAVPNSTSITITITGTARLCVDDFSWTSYVSADPHTVTLKDDNSTLTQSSAGESVTLPSRESCDGYKFVGWTKSWNDPQTSWTTTAPTIIPTGSYTPTANESLYPVYTKTEGGTPVPATLTASYTSYSGWTATNCGGSSYWVLKSGASITSPVISDLSTVTSITFTVRTYGGDTYKTVNVSTSGGISIGSASASNTTLTLKTINVSTKLSGSGSIVFSSTTTSSSNGPGINEITINYSTGGSTTYYISVPNCCTQLAEVTNLEFSDITSNRITVGVPNTYAGKDNASGYTFNCYSASTGGSLVATADENGTSHTFTGLNKNTTYYFTIIAKGEGNYCNSAETSPRESSKTLTQYTVTLNPNGGSGTFTGWIASASNYTKTVDADTKIDLPELTKTGYDFAGWYDGELVNLPYTVTKTVTLTAQWTAKTYNIIYKDQGNADFTGANEADLPATHTYGQQTDLVDATKSGYNFLGWFTTSNCSSSAITQLGATDYTDDITLYSKWEEIHTTCTVTYDANGGTGTVTDDTEYTNGASVTVKGNYGKLTKDGYAFTGWNTESDGNGTPYNAGDKFVITTNTTLYAQWCSAHWVLVTNTSEIEDDTRIIIAAKDYNAALSTNQKTDNRGQATITKKYNTVIFGEDVQKLSLEVGISENTFALNTGLGYLYAASSSANQLKTRINYGKEGSWNISFDGVVARVAALGNTHNTLSYNKTSELFSCYLYDKTQKDVVIYKEVCKQDSYNVKENLSNATAANTNAKTVLATATSLTLNYSANVGYLLPETITVQMGGATLVSGTDYIWNQETGELEINVDGFYGNIDVTIEAEEDPCYTFTMSEVTATSTTNSITLTWTEVAGATGYNVRLDEGELTTATGFTHTFTGLSPKTTYNWEVQAVSAICEDSKTGSTDTQKETFTVSWSVNGNVTSTESVVDGESIQDTPLTPSDQTLEDCGVNKFMGWSEKSAGSTPQDEAYYDDLCTAAQMKSKHSSVTGDKTFYAVFATAEETTGGTVEATLSFANTAQRTSLSDEQQVWTQNGVTLTNNKGSGSDIVDNSNPARFYKNSEIIVTHTSNEITTIVFDCNSNNYATALQNSIGTISGATVSNSSDKVTVSFTSAVESFAVTLSSGQVRLDQLTVTAGGGTSTTYSNYVTNCCNTPAPTNGAYTSVSGTEIKLTWNGTVSRYHITCANPIIDDHTESTSYTVSSLTECEEYTFYVSADPKEGCESEAIAITAQPFSGAKTVNYDYNGGSGPIASFTTSCDNDKQEIILPAATRSGYTFEGWYDSEENKVGDAGATYDPATSPITLYAHWTEITYQLNHSGSNYTITENKTSIKSSDTPFTLNYTCTGNYGFPSTISITGGGKSWTAGTDYEWTVAADKQSATLTINQTAISADVTITINMATRYTVTFVHNDKGVFDGESTIEVLSSENTITLPTVEDISCGFYDTFEGWIVSNDEYVESTTKPATVYAGGASYKVTGDCTFRALYSKCEGDATQVYRKVTATGEVTDGTYILVANTSTPQVYSGYGDATYGSSVEGLIADGEDFATKLPASAKPITVTVGTGTDAGTFAMYNADRSKYLTYTGSSNTLNESDTKVFIWKLTDGSTVNTKSCPAGVLTPNGFDTRVLQCNTASSNRFACYENSQSAHVFLYKLIDKCTKYYSTNPSCEKPVGVRIVYHANAVDANMSCDTQRRTYKVENEVNKYPQLASQLQFCTNATREGYTLVGWNTQENGQGTTYNINQNYYRLPVSGELDGDNWITLNLYAMWKPCIKFNLGNATGGTGVPDAIVENGECVLPEPTAEQLGTIPCAYEFYAWSETSVNATQSKPTVWMPGDTYTGSATTLYAVYRYAEGMGGSDTYYFTFNKSGKTYCITAKHNSYDRFVVAEQSTGLIFGLENGYLYYLDEGVKTFVYWEGDGTTVTTTTTYPNNANQKTTFVEGDNGTTIVTPARSGRYLQMPSSYTDRAYYTNDGTNPTLVEVEAATYTYATNPTCYTTANLHFMTNGGTLNYPTSYDETNYQELTAGSTVLLPTATFAGEWTFEGWKRGEPLENQADLPYDPSFYPVTLDATLFVVDEVGDIYFYAVYSKTVDDKQFDEVNGGTYKLYAIQNDDTKIFMPAWNGGRGTMSGVTECYLTGDYTITPGTGEHAGQYQITCGGHTLGVVSDADTDHKEVEGTWWNIEPSESGKGTWRITVVGSSNRALSALSGSFGNYSLTQLDNAGQTQYRDMEIGECIFTEYTSTPENIPYITVTGAPVRITSTNGERVYASTTIHIEAHNFTGERIIHLSATNGFGVTPTEVRTNGQGVYSGNVKVYYEPTTDGDGQTITTSVLTAAQTGGTTAEKISQTFSNIQGRNLPANFVIAAKWDGHWYALPANCTSSNSSTEGLLIEVDDVDNPTRATQAPASAKYGIREVIPSRQTDHGQGVVFTERYSNDNKEYSLYNGTSTSLQVYSQYSNYAATNPERYEWTPSTTDFVEYTLTNANSSRKITLNNSGVFSATTASGQVRLLPATFYEPAPVQVLKWKENSVIVMYTGAETTATTQVGTNAVSAAQTLENQKLTHGIFELTTTQALTGYARDVLVLYFGANTKVEMEIPLIVSGNVTASANGHDVVILENSKLTAAATKYSYKDVYVYGGGKLAVPASTSLGVNNIILRAGGIATNGAGADATYQYIYPEVELKGTFSSTKTDIKYEYVTDYDHWYHFVLPFNGNIKSITYPTEYYGDHVALDNTGSWVIKRYDGATRATGNYNAWVDIESEAATTTTAGQGYIFWGAPKKVSVNGGTKVRQQWGIQRITMPITSAEKAVEAETGDKTIEDLGSYANVANNSGKDNDQGWNLIGNPYMVNLTDMSTSGLHACKLVEVIDPATGKWNGQWEWNDETNIRYLTIPSDHFDTYTAKTVTQAVPLVPGRAFFVQLEGEANGVTFAAANRASLMPQHLAAQNKEVAVETGIILSNETMQDEVNFWIKDGKTNDYEYNADYPKTPNSTNFNIYGVHINGNLSWVATGPEYAEESMPIGYQVPAAGTYTLSISETYYSDLLDALYVTDHAMSPELTVDLMNAPYEFSVNQAETNNERFTISVKLKSESQGPTTGLENTGVQRDGTIKFIYQDKIFILHHGKIYDATGKQITTINK